ncbi:hypothetical protein [Oharaeibacter diazotrophicus]|uniref:Uncharacterized protein n=1 Tax=Oharaeibacter diazotrophicus TaxID=1920512 RepID=A0A4R6RFE8_9HYPH|nr:hypothetical protein [Oharaeibacter diazotrophicus]TDP84386.1 hypothetical protein EDD54_2993 [Oharaeibacter diazotrophicus]BBE73424.1 hypothetical protein OHA_1_03035 [Pleomorphomonas sp. SM30]GLS75215.1 hypothetical protein GCM10007904_05500 [Oharaeibacter diazotrophicus]
MTIARSAFAAALATLAFGAAVPHASAAATIVGSDYNDRVLANCYGKAECAASFSAVPAGKTLVVTDASCRGSMPNDQKLVYLQLNSLKANGSYNYIDSVIAFGNQITNGLDNTYQAHQEMRFVVYAGEKPVASTLKDKSAGNNYMVCSIVGVLK